VVNQLYFKLIIQIVPSDKFGSSKLVKMSNSIDLKKNCKFVKIYFFAIRDHKRKNLDKQACKVYENAIHIMNHHSLAVFFQEHSEKTCLKNSYSP